LGREKPAMQEEFPEQIEAKWEAISEHSP
jgi:hypothetical protein